MQDTFHENFYFIFEFRTRILFLEKQKRNVKKTFFQYININTDACGK